MDNTTYNLQEIFSQILVFLPKIITALVIFIVTIYLANVLQRLLTGALKKREAPPQTVVVIGQMIRWSVLLTGIITALQQVEFDLTAFVTGLGILGFTIGFALQEIAQNFIAGLLLIIQQPFKMDDLVEVEGYTGNVIGIDLRATQLKTLDGQDIMIPNGRVFSSPIINYTRAPERRMELGVGVAYNSDLDFVEQTVLEAIREVPFAMEDPPPFISYHTFGESSINLNVYYWYDGVKIQPVIAIDAGVKAIKKAFDKARIEIPFPIRTIHMEGG